MNGAKEKGGPVGPPSPCIPKDAKLVASLLLEAEATEALVECSHTATFLKLLLAASPCWVTGRVDFERERVAFAAPSRACLEFCTIGHLDRDHVIIWVPFGFHNSCPC